VAVATPANGQWRFACYTEELSFLDDVIVAAPTSRSIDEAVRAVETSFGVVLILRASYGGEPGRPNYAVYQVCVMR